MTEEFPEISLLYSEPDILLRVFLMLDLEDLTAIEAVCKDWREFGKIKWYLWHNYSQIGFDISVVEENVWRKKLKQKEKTEWGFLLQQHKWQHLGHLEAKHLFLHLCSVSISEFRMSVENEKSCIEYEHYDKIYRNSTSILPSMSKVRKFRIRKSAERLFFDKRSRAQKVIMQMLPKERMFAKKMILLHSTKIVNFKCCFVANSLSLQTTMFYSQNPASRYLMSKLLVFGPSSFPLLTTKSGAVVMAAGYYG